MSETLLGADDGGLPRPGLAAAWSVSDDGLSWRLTLREGAAFHDGTPITAEAAVASLRRARIQPGPFSTIPFAAIEAEGADRLMLGPLLVQVDPARQSLSRALEAPSAEFWLGTDHLGRSVLARLAHAARLSVTLAAVSVAAVAGVGLGFLAAWAGGWVDRVLSAVADAFLALPGLLLVLLLAAVVPGAAWALFVGLSLAAWVEWFRVSRAAGAAVIGSPAVEAARLLSFGWGHVLRRHLLPEKGTLLGTLAALGLGNAVLAVGALGFVGVGLRPPTPE